MKPQHLWGGGPFPPVARIPLLDEVTHVVVHRGASGDGFLHGAAIVHHGGTWYTSWGSSPVDENSPLERECGRRSHAGVGAHRWGPAEEIGPNLGGEEARSHGVFHVQDGVLWSLVPRFGRPHDAADVASTFPGLVTDALRLNPDTGRWELHAEAVARGFWPMDASSRLPDGRWIMGGLSGQQNAVVAVASGARAPLAWQCSEIPRPAGADMSFGETTVLVWPEAGACSAIIRYRAGSLAGLPEQVALVSTSSDGGRTWTPAAASNLPMTASKPYAGRLSTGQAYLVCNVGPDRHTLVLAVTAPGERVFTRVWRIRHGSSPSLRLPGRAKSPQWSYPYAHEHAGRLYVVYSIGKEDCGLSIIPLHVLA